MHYDLIVIGGGPAGYTAAISAAQHQFKTALIEHDRLGGTCLNRGCIPTKALLHAAAVYREITQSAKLGIQVSEPTIDLVQTYAYKDQIVDQLVSGIQTLITAHHIDYYQQTASFVDEHTLRLKTNQEILDADHIIIATGSRPIRLSLPGMDLPGVYTSDELLRSPVDQPRIIIIGGGVIGCELADFYSSINRQVTIIELQKRLLSTADRELAQNLTMTLRKKGVTIITEAQLLAVTKDQDALVCHYRHDQTEQCLTGDAVILSIGRRANTEQLALEKAGITTERGYIPVDGQQRTVQEHILALGDVNGGVQLAHAASAQAVACIQRLAGKPVHPYRTLPYCIYTNPEIAYAGLSEEEAKERYGTCQTSKFSLTANGKYLIEAPDRGSIKLIFHDDVIIGAQLFMERATEFIAYLITAIDNQLTYRQLTGIVFPHPTVSEAFKETMENIHHEAIHIMPLKR